jgi:dCTP deaminase
MESRINPNSYNLTLLDELWMVCGSQLDVYEQPTMMLMKKYINTGGYNIIPGRVYLGCTVEWTATDVYVPCIEGRSSMARMGLSVHNTAGFGDVGYKGRWTLEITSEIPILIYPGMEICQIYYQTVSEPHGLYNGKYQGAVNAIGSRIFEEFKGK